MELSFGDAGELEGFSRAGVAGDDGNLGRRDVQSLSEEFDNGFVGASVFGGLGDFDFEGVAENAGDLGARGVGDDFDVQEEGVVFWGDVHGDRVTTE